MGEFFSGWNADRVVGFGLDAFNSHTKTEQAKADRAEADAAATAYAATQQRTAPKPILDGISRNMMIGGGVAAALLLVLLLKGK